ncbi:MAG: aspartate kinase, partial [Cycloclasticus sp.]
MSLHVHKYGGTSVGTTEKIQDVARKLVDEKNKTG